MIPDTILIIGSLILCLTVTMLFFMDSAEHTYNSKDSIFFNKRGIYGLFGSGLFAFFALYCMVNQKYETIKKPVVIIDKSAIISHNGILRELNKVSKRNFTEGEEINCRYIKYGNKFMFGIAFNTQPALYFED